MAGDPSVRIRMYRQGLGDCFLLSFNLDSEPVHFLIDCGTLGSTTTGVKLKDVVDDIAREVDSRLDVLVATHEHQDHVSGFGESAVFDRQDIAVKRAWVAWTENPDDPRTRAITKDRRNLKAAVALTAQALSKIQRDGQLESIASGMNEILGFFADYENPSQFAAHAKGVDAAMKYVTTHSRTKPRFLKPGEVLEPTWLPGVRIYVLGPPPDMAALRRMGDHGDTELYSLDRQFAGDITACARLRVSGKSVTAYRDDASTTEWQKLESRLPFDRRFRIDEKADSGQCEKLYASYFDPQSEWRRIDDDWLASGATLAMQLDNYTNNTSLVLAFELIDSGRVLLFPADAQLGNWASWDSIRFKVRDGTRKRTVRAEDLLRRTVFYKVGHHGSHNATIRKRGLELMESEDLVAMIPLDRQVAMKKRPPWQMPADALYRRLIEKTSGRVIRSDTGWPEDRHRPSDIPVEEWRQIRDNAPIEIHPNYIDFKLP